MPIHLYNSLTKTKEEFIPADPKKVLFYVCGPTVYDEFHIGNARSFVVFDTIRRWLLARDYQVNYVQNITDVDDKIINRAIKLKVSPTEVADKYTLYYFEKQRQLGILPATSNPRATNHMQGIIDLVKKLIERGHAYVSPDGSVWFEVGTFPEYGKLSRMPLDQIREGERVDEEQQKLKKSPLDFSLWKAAKAGEPYWDSPWGRGRPGWHIECSCMAMQNLGSESIDIHGGGADLKFPHHENEIAQSECATGKPFAKYWLHNGMLDIDGAKMAKSVGNFRTIDDVLRIIDPLTLRYFLISARYRDKLDFTEDNLHKCRSAVRRIIQASQEANSVLLGATADDSWIDDPELDALSLEFHAAMDDDINTPGALGVIGKLVTLMNTVRAESTPAINFHRLARCVALLDQFRLWLGLLRELEPPREDFEPKTLAELRSIHRQLIPAPLRAASPDQPAEMINELITMRATARKEKNFALGDQIRKDLHRIGILLEDKADGTVWKKA